MFDLCLRKYCLQQIYLIVRDLLCPGLLRHLISNLDPVFVFTKTPSWVCLAVLSFPWVTLQMMSWPRGFTKRLTLSDGTVSLLRRVIRSDSSRCGICMFCYRKSSEFGGQEVFMGRSSILFLISFPISLIFL